MYYLLRGFLETGFYREEGDLCVTLLIVRIKYGGLEGRKRVGGKNLLNDSPVIYELINKPAE